MDPLPADLESARRRIAGIARTTPLLASPGLAARAGAAVHLKLECQQTTGSFKVRGAANRILSLAPEERARGVAACSSGNHGLAVAYVAGALGIPAVVCVPRWVDPAKLAAIRALGAQALLCGESYDEAAAFCRELAAERGRALVHPFDDAAVIAGQGTVGLEILAQLPEVDTAVVPLSGGGLVAGVALALKAARPGVRVVAASAERAAVMAASLRAGRPVALPEEETLATALAGGIGGIGGGELDNRHTFGLVRRLVDEVVTVTEEEIAAAMAFALERHRLAVEGGGAVGIAAVLHGRVAFRGGPLAVVVSGGNIDLPRLAAVLAGRSAVAAGRC